MIGSAVTPWTRQDTSQCLPGHDRTRQNKAEQELEPEQEL